MKIRRRMAAVAATVTAVLFTAACAGGGAADEPPAAPPAADQAEEAAAPGDDEAPAGDVGAPYGHLRLGTMAIPPSWDIEGLGSGHEQTAWTAVADTILRWNPDGSPAPGLAESWEVSEDRLTVTLNIRDGVYFTDGNPADAAAVVANMEAFKASSTRNLSMADHIAAVEADGNVVTLTMSGPDPIILRSLGASLGIVTSPDSWDNPDAATRPVGSGPYIMDDASISGVEYVFTANPDYWDTSWQRFERVTITFFEDATALNNAILGGQIDVANVWGDMGVVPQFEAAGFNTSYVLLDWFGFIIGDRDGEVTPELADVRVRQAINYAIDREGILNVFNHGRGEVTNQIFGPATTGFVPEIVDRFPFDPERGRELVEEAGAVGAVIPMITSSAFDTGMMAALAQQLEDVGLVLEPTMAAPGEMFNDMRSGRYSVMPMWLSTTNTWQQADYSLVPGGLFNFFGTENAEVAAFLEVIQGGSDAEAAAAAQELSAWLVENAWFAPIYFNQAAAIYADWIDFTGVDINIMPPAYLISPVR